MEYKKFYIKDYIKLFEKYIKLMKLLKIKLR